MKTAQRLVVLIGWAITMTGCSSELLVTSKSDFCKGEDIYRKIKNKCVGLPFRIPKTYVLKGVYEKSTTNKAKCTPTNFVKPVSLPTDETFYIKLDPPKLRFFSANELTIGLNDNGTLNKVILNADPEGSEIIASTAGLIGAIRGSAQGAVASGTTGEQIGADKVVLTASLEPKPKQKEVLCDTGERFVDLVPIGEWTETFIRKSEEMGDM